MNYKVRINNQSDSGDGISVEAMVNGEAVAHTFPKGMGFFQEPNEGRPAFVEKLIEKYEEKVKREKNVAQGSLTAEERKIHNNKFQNKIYEERSENFKDEGNENNVMEVDLNKPEQIRTYLKENMAEGYLSEEEGLNIDQFVDRYKELMETKENFQEIIEQVQTGRVQ